MSKKRIFFIETLLTHGVGHHLDNLIESTLFLILQKKIIFIIFFNFFAISNTKIEFSNTIIFFILFSNCVRVIKIIKILNKLIKSTFFNISIWERYFVLEIRLFVLE